MNTIKTNQTSKKVKQDKHTRAIAALPVTLRSRLPVVCPPERQGTETGRIAIGYLCRALILWWAVFGLGWFVADAFLLTTAHDGPLSPLYLAGIAAGAVTLFAVMSISNLGCLLGALALCGGIAAGLLLKPIAFWVNHGAEAVNACIERLIRMGYGGPAAHLIELPAGAADRSVALHLAAALLVLLLAAVFVPSIIRRTHLLLPTAVAAAILIPVFTYNISRSNWPLCFVVAAFAAILVLAAYDRRYLRRPRDCDNEAHLFPTPADRPKVLPRPAHLEKKRRREPEVMTADEEITAYLTKKPKKVKPPRAQRVAEQKARRQAEREYRASVRALRRWRRRQSAARIAAGGFAGIGILALAMLVLLIPAAVAEKSFAKVAFIDEPMQIVRRYVTAYLMGDNPILDEMGYGGNASNFAPHTTDLEPRHFTGEEIFQLETMYNTNLYLRGWVAADYRDGAWHTADSRGGDVTFENYRKTFGTTFSPELLRTNFYRFVDPAAVNYTDYTRRYQNNTERGFVTMQVNLRRVGGNSNMVYAPAYYNPQIGILKYCTSEPTDYSYVNYYDGIYTGRRFLPGAEYAAVVYATTMRDDTFMEKVSVDIAAYNLACLLERGLRDRAPELGRTATFVSESLPIRVDLTTRETGTAVQLTATDPRFEDVPGARTLMLAEELLTRFLNFGQAERAELDYAVYVEDLYRDFVYSTYRKTAESPIITDIAHEIVDDDLLARLREAVDAGSETVLPDSYAARHEAVMRVMHYLAQTTPTDEVDEEGNPIEEPVFTYTLNATVTPDPALDGVENFLTVTREGYCVQFASAATLILRELGIPARYVEGYLAHEFRRNPAAISDQRYSATVRDYNAHAWVEVWYDGIGWLNYEATPTYMADMYEPLDSGNVSSSYTPWTPRDEEEEETPIDLEELARLEAEALAAERRRRMIIIACVASGTALVLLGIVLFVATLIRRARRADEAREARYAAVEAGTATRADARVLIDETAALLDGYGFAPETGELRDDYAARLTEPLGALCPTDLVTLFAAIAAEEFGHGMDAASMQALAAFRRALGDAAKAHLPAGKRLLYRYGKRHLL